MKRNKTIYLIFTGLFSALMLFSAGMYFFNHPEVIKAFEALNYPTYLIYPLAIAKVLGLIAIWSKKSKTLEQWAYAGFFFNLLLASFAHISVGDGEFAGAVLGLVFLSVSYISSKKLIAA